MVRTGSNGEKLMALQVIIDGNAAEKLGADLARQDGIAAECHVQQASPRMKSVGAAATAVVTIVSAVGGLAGLVDSVLGWRDRVKKRPEADEHVIILVAGDTRRPLMELTPDVLLVLAAENLDEDR